MLLAFCKLITSCMGGVRLELVDYGFMAEAIRFNTNFMTYRFNNVGDEGLRGNVHADLYFSTDAILDGSDRLLGQIDRSYDQFPVSPGGQTLFQIPMQVPDVAPGIYSVILVLSGSVNTQFVGPFQVLAPDFLVYDFGSLGPVSMSEPFQLTWILKNTGNGTSIGTNSQRVFYSTDATLSEDDLLVTGVVSKADLGKDFMGRLITPEFTMPVVPRGYFLVQADSTDGISELSEQNNVFAFPLPPQKEIIISQQTDRVRISWQTIYGDQKIEYSDLVYPLAWNVKNVAREVVNGFYVAEFPKPQGSQVYRLKTP
jgi:hypothetical protein